MPFTKLFILYFNHKSPKRQWFKGQQESKEEIARKLLAEGMSVEFAQKITGLDIADINMIAKT
jgi:hypothetical protein